VSVDPQAPATRLVYDEAELLRSHESAEPHVVGGRRLHGGFDAAGRYLSPRMLVRGPAVRAWSDALRARGGEPLAADASLLAGIRYPSFAQSKLLLVEGLGEGFWNTLTLTGHIEARGRILAAMKLPDFQEVVIEDIGGTALGHLHRGLLKAHGLDEGGEPERGIGGHDVMWFTLRDLAFGPNAWPEPPEPPDIRRPESDIERNPPIAEGFARLVYFLLNLLLIEFRAERFFETAQCLLQDPDLFVTRRSEAEQAARLVDRIRQDEEIHVTSLRLVLGEIRAATFRTRDGGRISGHEIVDDFWREIVHWATVLQPRLAAAQQRRLCEERIARHPRSAWILREFHALAEADDEGVSGP